MTSQKTAPDRARTLEFMPLDEVPRADRNPKEHDLPAIRKSIEQFGCTVAGVLDERTGRLVAGHGRLAALTGMREEGASPPDGITVDGDGAWLVPIVRGWASRSDSEAAAYLIADNRLSEKGGWDNRVLAEVLDEFSDQNPDLLTIAGYSAEELDDLLHAFSAPPSLDDLEEEYGDPKDEDLWPLLRFRVPPAVRNDFYDLSSGDDDAQRFIALINRVKAAE